MAMHSIKVETPGNLDSIFSLECFKYNEMKGLFRNIYDYLTQFGIKFKEVEDLITGIPDFTQLKASKFAFD